MSVIKHRRPALRGARGIRLAALCASVAGLAIAVIVPSTVGVLLVVSALAAGIVAVLAAARGSGVDSKAWLLLGVGQLFNSAGNLAIAVDSAAWFADPSWLSTLVFSLATLSTVVGLVLFLMPPRHSQLIGIVTTDLLVVLGCVFILGWTWELPQTLGAVDEVPSVWGVMGFLAIVLDLIGIAFGALVWTSRPPHQRAALRLAIGSLALAALGDTGIFAAKFHLSDSMASLTWVASSLVLLVGATYVPALATPLRAMGERPFLSAATGSLAATVIIVMLSGGPEDSVVETTMSLVLLVLLARHSHLAYTKMQLAERLAASERHYRNLVDGTQDVIVVVGDDGRIGYASPSAHELFGIDNRALPGLAAPLLFGGVDLSKAPEAYGSTRNSTADRVELTINRPDGTTRHVEALRSRAAEGYVVSLRDVTDRVEILRQVEEAARRDPLTGLPNRRSFEESLRERLEATEAVSVVICDLDGFKRVNDTSGHAAGDAILKQVAQRLEAAMTGSLVARFGGDEFAILLRRSLNRDSAVALVQHAQAKVGGAYRVAGQEITILMTAGLTVEDSSSAPEIMRNADLALYQAKATGRGALRLFEHSMYESAMRRVELDERLRKALATNALSVMYQPVVEADTGAVTAAEALVRWLDDNGEVMLPQDLVALAESTGTVSILGEWVLGRAIEQAAAWKHAGHPIPIAVNVSAEQLLVGDLAHTDSATAADGIARARAADSGDHRERAARRGRDGDRDDGPAPVDRHSDRHRRLRHRLLELCLPRPAARRPPEDRPLLRRARLRRRHRDRDRENDDADEPRPRAHGDRRGRRDHGPAAGLARDGCAPDTGVLGGSAGPGRGCRRVGSHRLARGCRQPRHPRRPRLSRWPLVTNRLNVLHRRAQLAEPLVGVLADEPHAPLQRVGARPRDPGIDQGVEHLALRLAKAGHHREGEVGEQCGAVVDGGAPRHRAVEAVLGLAGNRHPGVARLLAPTRDAAGCGLGLGLVGCVGGEFDRGRCRRTVISSRSTVMSGASVVHSAGNRPANQAVMSEAEL